jgi:hypothetical protein
VQDGSGGGGNIRRGNVAGRTLLYPPLLLTHALVAMVPHATCKLCILNL